jgi:hypothetical protein
MRLEVQTRKEKQPWKTKYLISPKTGESGAYRRRQSDREAMSDARFYFRCLNVGPGWRKRLVEIADNGEKFVHATFVYPTIG